MVQIEKPDRKPGHVEPDLHIVQKREGLTSNEPASPAPSVTQVTPSEKIAEIYEEFKAETIHAKLNTANAYMEHVLRKIDLQQLYNIHDYLLYEAEQEVCPVFLEIKNQDLLDSENRDTEQGVYKYLLQVWKSTGTLLYERRLQLPLLGWGMHKNTLIFQERPEEVDGPAVLHMVIHHADEHGSSKLQLHKILLPDCVRDIQPCLSPDQMQTKFQMVGREKFEEENEVGEQYLYELGLTAVPGSASLPPQNHERKAQKCFGFCCGPTEKEKAHKKRECLIERLNDYLSKQATVKRNIYFSDGEILLGGPTTLIELSLNKLQEQREWWTNQAIQPDQKLNFIEFPASKVRQISLGANFRFVEFIYIGQGKQSMVLQNSETGQLRFMALRHEKGLSADGLRTKRELQFNQLGLIQKNNIAWQASNIVKTCTAVSRVVEANTMGLKKSTEGVGKIFNVSLSLRSDGSVEAYSNFTHANTLSTVGSTNLFCFDLWADHEYFYLKYLRIDSSKSLDNLQIDADEIEGGIEVRKVSNRWQNGIKLNKSVQIENQLWSSISLKTLSNYMKLYCQWVELGGYLLIAHRNYISVYNLTAPADSGNSQWVSHWSCERDSHIRELFLEKTRKDTGSGIKPEVRMRYHAKSLVGKKFTFTIVVLVGLRKVVRLTFKNNALTPQGENFEEYLDGIVMRFFTDFKYRSGNLTLVEVNPDKDCALDSNATYQRINFDQANPVGLNNLLATPAQDLNHHLVYTNEIEQARERFKTHKYAKLYHLKKGINKAIYNKTEAGVSYDKSKPLQDLMIEDDTQIIFVQSSLSFWKQQEKTHSSELRRRINCAHKPKLTALLLYQRNKYVKLVPFYPEGEGQKNKDHDEDCWHESAHAACPIFRQNLLLDDIRIVMDQKTCIEKLRGEKILHFRFISKQMATHDIKENGFIVACESQLSAFDHQNHEVARISGLDLDSASYFDGSYLYVVSDSSSYLTEQYASFSSDWQLGEQKRLTLDEAETESGFKAINIHALYRGQFQEVWVAHGATGQNNRVANSWTSNSLSLIKSLHALVIMPKPHWNLMSFVGMESKNDYLLWKSSTNGFFSALAKNGEVSTWSIFTGELLWVEPSGLTQESLKGYEVFRSDRRDETYTGGYYCRNNSVRPRDSHSLTLLVSRCPVHKQGTMRCQQLHSSYHTRTKISQELERQTKADLADFDPEMDYLPDTLFVQQKKVVLGDEVQIVEKPRKFKSKLSRSKLYHFKVLKMRQWEDLKRINPKETGPQPKTESSLLFHFFHKLLEPFEPQMDFKTFDWYLRSDVRQRLYLSADTHRMLEVVLNRIATVWTREDSKRPDQGQLVSWHKEYRIPKFPFLANEVSTTPYFMASDFSFMCDYDQQRDCISIVRSRDHKLIDRLPGEAIGNRPAIDDLDGAKEAFACIAVRHKNGQHSIETLNPDSGLLTTWPIYNKDGRTLVNKENSESFKAVYFRTGSDWDGHHRFVGKGPVQKCNTSRRVFQRMEAYKLAMNKRHSEEGALHYADVLEQMQEIDYSAEWTSYVGSFWISRSFTWMDWKLAERVQQQPEQTYTQLQKDEQLRLLGSIFPQGNSLLRMLSVTDQNASDSKSKQASVEKCMAMFDAAEEGFAVRVNGTWEEVIIEVPLIADCFGMQPTDYAAGYYRHIQDHARATKNAYMRHLKKFNLRYVPITPEQKVFIENQEDQQLLRTILNRTRHYSFYANTFNIVQPVSLGAKQGLNDAFEFLNARQIPTKFIPSSSQNAIKPEHLIETDEGEFGVIPVHDLNQWRKTQQALFEETGEAENLKNFNYFWFDVPLVFANTKEGCKFMRALEHCTDINVFAHPGVQLIIKQQWKGWEKQNFWTLMFPMFCLLLAFTIRSCFLTYSESEDPVIQRAQNGLDTVVSVLGMYFIVLGAIMVQHVGDSLNSILEILFGFLVTSIVTLGSLTRILREAFDEEADHSKNQIVSHAFASVLLWFKFLMMLRYKEWMSSPIAMVLTCIKTLGPYITILLIGLLAFTDAFNSIAQLLYIKTRNETDPAKLISPPYDKDTVVTDFVSWNVKWTAEWALGFGKMFIGSVNGLEFDQTEGYSDTEWLLFVSGIVFTAILLMNLLLAMVGQVFSDVHSLRKQYFYQQLVYVICALQLLYGVDKNQTKGQQVLLLAKRNTVSSELINAEPDQMKEKREAIKSVLTEIGDKLNEMRIRTEQKRRRPAQNLLKDFKTFWQSRLKTMGVIPDDKSQ